MHIIVAGMGEVGRYIAEVLAREDHNVVAIDADHDALAHAEETLDAMFLHGHAGNLNTLRQAQVERADLFIAVTDNSEANLLSAIRAAELGAHKTIARVADSEYFESEHGRHRHTLQHRSRAREGRLH